MHGVSLLINIATAPCVLRGCLLGQNRPAHALRADNVDFEPDETGNAVISERFFRGALDVYRLWLDTGQVLHSFNEHAVILPVGRRVRTYISAGHRLVVFQEGRVVSQG